MPAPRMASPTFEDISLIDFEGIRCRDQVLRGIGVSASARYSAALTPPLALRIVEISNMIQNYRKNHSYYAMMLILYLKTSTLSVMGY